MQNSIPRRHWGDQNEAPVLMDEVVAQLDRAADCGSAGRTFESCQPQIASLHKIKTLMVRIT